MFPDSIKNISSIEEFRKALNELSKEDKEKVVDSIEEINIKSQKPHPNAVKLFHGTPEKISDFKLTKGKRTGVFDSEYQVDNLGIFMTDSKPMAHFFGKNRGDEYQVYDAFVDLGKCLDANIAVPGGAKKIGLGLVNKYYGTKKKELAQSDIWWLLDNKEFVDELKKQGYDSVKFKETKEVRRKAGDESGNTYFIFDPKKIKIISPKNNIINTKEELWEYLNKMKTESDSFFKKYINTYLSEDFKTSEKKFLDQGIDKEEIRDYFDKFKKARDSKIKDVDDKNIDNWSKKDFKALKDFVDKLEVIKTKSQLEKETKMEGAKLVAENKDWKVYRITEHEACKLYGSGTKWCITQPEDRHWKHYSKDANFYFLISKTLNKDNKWYKIALEAHKSYKKYWDAEDEQHSSLPTDLPPLPDFETEHKEHELKINGEEISLSKFMAMDNLKIDGDLSLVHLPITKLPDGLEVPGTLSLGNNPLEHLPSRLKVGRRLHIYKLEKLKSLPSDLEVDGTLAIHHTGIKKLPKKMKVGKIEGFVGNESDYPQYKFEDKEVNDVIVESDSFFKKYIQFYAYNPDYDEDLEEVTAYHGTTKAFDKFTTGKHTGKIGGIYGYGAYLTDKPEVASDYAGGLKDKYPKGSSVHIYNLDNLKFWDVYNSKQNSLIAKELGITEKISTMDVDGYHAIKKAMDSEISDDKKKELITKAVVKVGFDGCEFPQAKKETQYVVYNIEKLKHKFAESTELTEQPNVAQSAPTPPPAPQGMNQPPNPEKADQKRKQMGTKANSWLKSFGRIMPNVSRELQTGNMGQNASQFFTMLAQMPKQDWYRYYFKQ